MLPTERALFRQLVPPSSDEHNKNITSEMGQNSKEKDGATKRESDIRKYLKAYYGAIELIQNAPNIVFDPARIDPIADKGKVSD